MFADDFMVFDVTFYLFFETKIEFHFPFSSFLYHTFVITLWLKLLDKMFLTRLFIERLWNVHKRSTPLASYIFNVLFIFPYRFYYIESIMTYGNLPSLSESSNSNTYMMPIANIQSPQGSIDNNNNNSNNLKQSTAMTFVQKISNLEGKSVLAKLEEMEKCMDYLQQQLKEHAGCINAVSYTHLTLPTKA